MMPLVIAKAQNKDYKQNARNRQFAAKTHSSLPEMYRSLPFSNKDYSISGADLGIFGLKHSFYPHIWGIYC